MFFYVTKCLKHACLRIRVRVRVRVHAHVSEHASRACAFVRAKICVLHVHIRVFLLKFVERVCVFTVVFIALNGFMFRFLLSKSAIIPPRICLIAQVKYSI